jgi:hypothetical protein
LRPAEARYLQELDRVCALSSPRMAFERRLDYLARNSTWTVASGWIQRTRCTVFSCYGDEYEDRKIDPDDVGFDYCVYGKEKLVVSDKARAAAFLSQDHGNYVCFSEVVERPRTNDLEIWLQKIWLFVLPVDVESLSVKQIKRELKRRGLSDSVEMADLVARLQNWKGKG